MALSNPLPLKTFERIGANLDVKGGQLGVAYDASFGSSSTLFSFEAGANRYFLDPTVGSLEIELPAISESGALAGTAVRHGYSVWIKNISTTNSFDIVNAASTLITSLDPGIAVILNASVNEADDWYIVGGVSEAGLAPVMTTLQAAYDNSGAVDPQIQLDTTGAGLKIRDDPTFLDPVFDIADSAGTGKFMTVKNAVATTDSPAIDLLGGDSQATDSMTIGAGVVSSQANSITMGSGLNLFTNPLSGSLAMSFPNGSLLSSGSTLVGTSGSDTFQQVRMTQADSVVVNGQGSATTVTLLPLELNTSYFVNVKVIGRDSDITSDGSVVSEGRYVVLSDGVSYTSTKFGFDFYYSGTITIGAVTEASVSGTDLVIDLLASDNITGGVAGTMDFRVITTYSAYTV